jgi:hypothetical protein
MNRRLHNSFTAFLASASALALCLALAMPAPHKAQPEPVALHLGPVEFTFTPDDPAVSHSAQVDALVRSIEHRADNVENLADAAALTAEIATAAALARSLDGARNNVSLDHDSEKKARTAARHRRQTLVMPYFSFAPRG